MEQEPNIINDDFTDNFIEYHWRRGWDEAINYALDIINEMKYNGYSTETLEELAQRIV